MAHKSFILCVLPFSFYGEMTKDDKLLTNCVDVLTASIRKKPDIHSFGTFLRREDEHHLAVGCMAKQAGSSEHLAFGIPEHKGRKFSTFA